MSELIEDTVMLKYRLIKKLTEDERFDIPDYLDELNLEAWQLRVVVSGLVHTLVNYKSAVENSLAWETERIKDHAESISKTIEKKAEIFFEE